MSGDPEFYARPSLNVESYDAQAAAGQPLLAGDVEFYLDLARRSGGPVLDLGGGTGRVSRSSAVRSWVSVNGSTVVSGG